MAPNTCKHDGLLLKRRGFPVPTPLFPGEHEGTDTVPGVRTRARALVRKAAELKDLRNVMERDVEYHMRELGPPLGLLFGIRIAGLPHE